MTVQKDNQELMVFVEEGILSLKQYHLLNEEINKIINNSFNSIENISNFWKRGILGKAIRQLGNNLPSKCMTFFRCNHSRIYKLRPEMTIALKQISEKLFSKGN